MKTHAIYILAIALVIAACNTHYQLYEIADCVMQEHPDSAFAILSSIPNSEIRPGRDRARHDLLLATALDKMYIDTSDISLIQYPVAYYTRIHDKESLFKSLYYQGCIYNNGGHRNEAVLSLTKASRLLPSIKDNSYQLLLYSTLSDVFHNCHNPKEALRYAELAMETVERYNLDKYRQSTKYLVAFESSANNDPEKALSIYDSLYRSSITDSVLLRRIFKGYAYSRAIYDQSDYQFTKELYDKAINSNASLQINDYCAYSYILGMLGEKIESENLFQSIDSLGGDNSNIAALWRYRLEANNHNYKNAYFLLEQAVDYQNSIAEKQFEQSLFNTQKDYFEAKLSEADLQMRNQRTRNLLLVTILCFLVIISSLIVLFILKRSKRIAREKEMANEALIHRLRIEHTKDQLRPLGQLFADYTFAVKRGVDEKDATSNLIKKLKEIISYNAEGQTWFDDMVNKSTNGALVSFNKDYPTMSDSNKMLFKLYAAGFDATIISILTDRETQNAVYIRKTRLKEAILNSESPNKGVYLDILG